MSDTEESEEQKSEQKTQGLSMDFGKLAVIFMIGRMGCGKSTAI